LPISPYAPPAAVLVDSPEFERSEHEAIRESHIRHEIQIKSIGALYYFSGGILLLTSVSLIYQGGSSIPGFDVMTWFFLFFGVFLPVLGYGFRRLRPWVRIPGGVVGAIGLLGFPIGTLFNLWILYLMFCEKGRTILSPDYQAVIAATPHVKYKRSVGDWIATGIIFGLLALVVVGVLVAMAQ